uniref:Uncharacterized protein n=1 Tax=Desertifilum tharense IPPAS B-1220 TaxID=1781255 RepID=A0ACD5GNG0_9CYAN
MAELLLNAYTPLIVWTGLGVVLFRFLPDILPRLIGRTLYWVGIPVMIFSLARRANFSSEVGLAPLMTVGAILLGFIEVLVKFTGDTRLSNSSGQRGITFIGASYFRSRSPGQFYPLLGVGKYRICGFGDRSEFDC